MCVASLNEINESVFELSLELKEETKIVVKYLLRIFRHFAEIRFIVLVRSKI